MASVGAMTLSFTVTGDAATAAKFAALPVAMQKKVLRPALRATAKIVQTRAITNIRSKSGVTAQSLKVRAAKRSRKFPDRVTVNVITAGGWFKGPAFYASFTELGWKAGSRKAYPFAGGERYKLGFRWISQRIPVAGKHWLKRAKESSQSAAQAVISRMVAEGIEREAKALAH